MNRPFWSFRSSSQNICDSLEPLLSAYADGMASSADARRIEAHLPECEGCRATLSWMQATRTVLSSRPVAVPPPDLHSRIALAIAASSPALVQLRPSRVFKVRTAYAAAASVTALGIALSYPLWYTLGEVAVHPAKPPVVAAVPAPAGKPHLTMRTSVRPLVASNAVPDTDAVKPPKHTAIARNKAPAAITPLEHVAVNTPPVRLPVVPQEVIAPVHHALLAPKTASHNIAPTENHSPEKHLPLPVLKTPLLEGPKVAKIIKEPTRVPLDIQVPKVTPDLLPAQVASIHETMSLRSDNILKSVVAHTEDMRKASLAAISAPVSHSAHDATNFMHTLDGEEHTAVIDAIHGNQ